MRFLLILLFLLAGCSAPAADPQQLVDGSIAWQNGTVLNKAELSFDFRDRQFRVLRNDGLFEYERRYVDTTGAAIRDLLTNDGLIREVDGMRVELDSAAYNSAETGVNSVVYFALLPLPLNDPAARKQLLGTVELDGREYHKVEVTFVPEGGGRDYDDRFIYWMDAESGALDYLAYYFHVNDGGSRFRKAYNIREIAGVRIADYYNYKGEVDLEIDQIQRYDSLYANGMLELVSEVNLENVRIVPLD
ncbi:MAG: hypothetical protein JJ896_16485 [Rhodothermales bacterium]|nr:hypothetical protein [Rhodothermales bacterium]MBO6781255.1 hypothetical protein [Rhodothermales bacterium]